MLSDLTLSCMCVCMRARVCVCARVRAYFERMRARALACAHECMFVFHARGCIREREGRGGVLRGEKCIEREREGEGRAEG